MGVGVGVGSGSVLEGGGSVGAGVGDTTTTAGSAGGRPAVGAIAPSDASVVPLVPLGSVDVSL